MTLTEKRIKTLARGVSSTVAKLQEEVSPKRVHGLRTTIRRIQSIMDYGQPRLNRKQHDALDELSRLRKRAGKVRDLDIQIALLNVLGNASAAADSRTLKETLQEKRARQAVRLIAIARKAERSKFLSHLGQLAQAVRSSAANSEPDAPLRLAQKQIAELAGRYGTHPQLKPKRLHEVRIALKMVRYLAELSEESEAQQRLLQQLKAVQDALGEWHDWEELSRTAEKQFSHRTNSTVLVEIRALFAARHTAALSAVSQLFNQHAAPVARKQPRSVPSRALAQRA